MSIIKQIKKLNKTKREIVTYLILFECFGGNMDNMEKRIVPEIRSEVMRSYRKVKKNIDVEIIKGFLKNEEIDFSE